MQQHRIGPETARLRHRCFQADDAEAFFRLNSDPDVMRYTYDATFDSVSTARKAIEDYPDFETVGYGRWATVLKSTNEIIGFCGLKWLPDINCVDVGYRFFPEFWGQGVATEACMACLQFGFAELAIDEIVGFVVPENLPSIRVLEKAGMRFIEGFDYDGTSALKYGIRREDWRDTVGATSDR